MQFGHGEEFTILVTALPSKLPVLPGYTACILCPLQLLRCATLLAMLGLRAKTAFFKA